MKRAILVGAICGLLGSGLTALSLGDDTTNAEFWLKDRGQFPVANQIAPQSRQVGRGRAAGMVASAVRQYVGDAWVAEGLRIAKVESGYRCDAVNRSSGATGLGQMMYASAEALEPGSGRRRADCETGARLMAKHMARCLAFGATTDVLMNRCHLAGWGSLARRLRPRAERYVASYQRLVTSARPVLVAEVSPWISLGSVALFR